MAWNRPSSAESSIVLSSRASSRESPTRNWCRTTPVSNTRLPTAIASEGVSFELPLPLLVSLQTVGYTRSANGDGCFYVLPSFLHFFVPFFLHSILPYIPSSFILFF